MTSALIGGQWCNVLVQEGDQWCNHISLAGNTWTEKVVSTDLWISLLDGVIKKHFERLWCLCDESYIPLSSLSLCKCFSSFSIGFVFQSMAVVYVSVRFLVAQFRRIWYCWLFVLNTLFSENCAVLNKWELLMNVCFRQLVLLCSFSIILFF